MARAITDYNQIVGHKNVIAWVRSCVERDAVPNIIIFHGNPGLGKTSIAKLLAVDVVTMHEKTEKREEEISNVIWKNQSTASIKLFNMSEIQEKEEEIQKVKAELTLGFSTTGRKVLLLDEAHNMSNKAQDALLTDLEHLQKGVYVFICTTEIGALREALLSRAKAQIALRDLSEAECKRLIRAEIQARDLHFAMSPDMITAFMASWANNQPRKAVNLLENFKQGSVVESRDIEVFINLDSTSNAVEMLKYIYGSMAHGIEFIQSLRLDAEFVNALIEVTKVVVGARSGMLSAADSSFIGGFMLHKDATNLLKFTAEVAGMPNVTKRRVVSAFIRSNVEYKRTPPEKESQEVVKSNDMAVLSDTIKTSTTYGGVNTEYAVESLEELFKSSTDIVEV